MFCKYGSTLYFNPRPREEGDESVVSILESKDISIHALVKRATMSYEYLHSLQEYFNPRPREEGDVLVFAFQIAVSCISIHALVKRATDKLKKLKDVIIFQSTPS